VWVWTRLRILNFEMGVTTTIESHHRAPSVCVGWVVVEVEREPMDGVPSRRIHSHPTVRRRDAADLMMEQGRGRAVPWPVWRLAGEM
jgi:hypothetical protein